MQNESVIPRKTFIKETPCSSLAVPGGSRLPRGFRDRKNSLGRRESANVGWPPGQLFPDLGRSHPGLGGGTLDRQTPGNRENFLVGGVLTPHSRSCYIMHCPVEDHSRCMRNGKAVSRLIEACIGANSINATADVPKWRNWQTRTTQNRVVFRPCGFDSHLRHQFFIVKKQIPLRGVAQLGRAPGLGPGGRRFKSGRPDQD